MNNIKLSLQGLYYLITGLVFAVIVWPFGNEFIRLISILFGILLICIGGLSIVTYVHILNLTNKKDLYLFYDGIVKICLGILILCIPIGTISSLIGFLFLIYTIIIAFVNNKPKDLYGKSLYKILIALVLIFCGIDTIGLWILRIIDILIIIYGVVLILLSTNNNSHIKNKNESNNSKVIDVDYDEYK